MSSDANNESGGTEPGPIESGSTETGESFCTPVVLVVEDEPLVRKAVARKLQAAGYEVVAVPSAADALIVSQRLVFHVLVLDLNLVDGDPFSGLHEGFAVIDWLRHQLGDLHQFRIVIYTSQAERHIAEKARACGAFAFCPKRRDMDNLLQCVNDAVESLNAPVAGAAQESAVQEGGVQESGNQAA
jgi:CheY-like chemotaxis protein